MTPSTTIALLLGIAAGVAIHSAISPESRPVVESHYFLVNSRGEVSELRGFKLTPVCPKSPGVLP